MKYISLIHALNLPCRLETCGDWHTSALQWEKPHIMESEGSVWGEYGIETGKRIPENEGLYNVANHIRACLDLLYIGNFTVAQGMNNDYICNDKYDREIFEKVMMLAGMPNWKDIDAFMKKEYLGKWVAYKKEMREVIVSAG